MNQEPWLPLTDYSTKHKISVSTLRRRIKADDINFRFEDGKYFILDQPVSTNQRTHRPSQDNASSVGAHQGMMKRDAYPPQAQQQSKTKDALQEMKSLIEKTSQSSQNFAPALGAHTFLDTNTSPSLNSQSKDSPKEEPILTAANKLLNELKKAYSLILQEKEEQILHLREEVTDLKTLVRVLESENDRLNGFKQ